jgi:hypothetical protein
MKRQKLVCIENLGVWNDFKKIVMMQEASEFKKGETVIRVNYSGFSECRGSVRNTDNPAHKPRNHTLYKYTTNSICISSNSEGSNKLPDDGKLLPKHVAASIQNKGVVQSVHIFGHF